MKGQLVKELEKSNRIMTNEKNKFLTIFESLTAPVVVLDKSDKIVSLNLAASSLFLDEQTPGSSYYRTDPLNKMPFQYSVEEIMPWAVKSLIGFKQGGFERLSLETRLHSGNKTQYYSVIFSPMLDISGKFGGTIIILEEITDQIMAEKARLKSERLKAIIETAGAVSHEINQPLQIALGAIELAMMENPEDRKLARNLKRIAECIDRISDITQRLNKITRYETKEYLDDQRILDLEKASEI